MADGWLLKNLWEFFFGKEFGVPLKHPATKIQLDSNYNICSFKGTSIHFDLVWNPSKRSQLTGISNLCGNQPDFVFQQMMLGHWSLMILLSCGLDFLSFLQNIHDSGSLKIANFTYCRSTADSNKTTLLSFLSSIQIADETVQFSPNNQPTVPRVPTSSPFWVILSHLKDLEETEFLEARGEEATKRLWWTKPASRPRRFCHSKKRQFFNKWGGGCLKTLSRCAKWHDFHCMIFLASKA